MSLFSTKIINLDVCLSLTRNILNNVTAKRYQAVLKALEIFIAAFLRHRLIESTTETGPDAFNKTTEILREMTAKVGLWTLYNLPKSVCADDKLSFSTDYEPEVSFFCFCFFLFCFVFCVFFLFCSYWSGL